MKEEDYEVQDAIMERPSVFRIDGKTYYIYPITLGKMLLMQRIMEQVSVDSENLKRDASLEWLRVVKEKKERCCELVAYLTARNDYYSVFDNDAFEERKSVFMRQEDVDIVSFMIAILSADKTDKLTKYLGIDVEQRNMKKVMKVKDDKNNYNFGGVSLYGYLLDTAMERYKMTKKQLVWEIDYTSLRLLLADKISTIYVTDEERRKIHITKDRTKVNGDDREAVMKVIQSETWE